MADESENVDQWLGLNKDAPAQRAAAASFVERRSPPAPVFSIAPLLKELQQLNEHSAKTQHYTGWLLFFVALWGIPVFVGLVIAAWSLMLGPIFNR